MLAAGLALVVLSVGATGAPAVQAAGLRAVPVEIALPEGKSLNDMSGFLEAVSCHEDGSCVAVGDYDTEKSGFSAMVATQSDGTWGRAKAIPVADGGASTMLKSLYCPNFPGETGTCVTVGYLTPDAGNDESERSAVVVAEGAGGWNEATTTEIAPPADDPEGKPFDELSSIFCRSNGVCTAVGSYRNSSGVIEPMVVTGDVNRRREEWKQAEALAPPEAGTVGGKLYGIACEPTPSPTTEPCLAVGDYTPSPYAFEPMVVSQKNGVWEAAKKLATPEPSEQAALTSVSCAAGCKAVGYYFISRETQLPWVDSETEAGWQPTSIALPAGATGELLAVSCYHAFGPCFASGDINLDNSGTLPTAIGPSGGSWEGAEALSLPANADSELQDAVLSDVAPTMPATAVGSYRNDHGQLVPMATELVPKSESHSEPPPKPVVRVESVQLTVEGARVRFRLACRTAVCSGAIAVVAKLTVKSTSGKRTKIRHESVVLAKGAYSLAKGSAKGVKLKLTAEGAKLLARAAQHRAHSQYPEPPARATITVTVQRGIAQSKTLKIVHHEVISGGFTLTPAE